jgi:hypothetical protein
MTYLLIVRVSNDKDTVPYKLQSDTIPRVGEIILYLESKTYIENRFIVDKVEHLYSEKTEDDHMNKRGYSVVDRLVTLEIYVTRTT